ncbi:MAG: tyrosine-type recombinase/integrase, partial [Chloroflexi bacterium]|nr:tyrosine-type recombinase/integrase [Chloroflexota bacterium]
MLVINPVVITGKTVTKLQISLESWIIDFLTDLKNANRSPHTHRAYASDLYRLAAFYEGVPTAISVDNLREFLDTFSHLKPATRARKQAALNSFFQWAYRQDLIAANPMAKIEAVKRDEPQIRALEREEAERILAVIPAKQTRDRLLFRLIFETGLRVGEALQLYVEDLDMTLDDEHIYVWGKGGKRRTVLLDDSKLVAQLRRYLQQTGYKHGPLFRAQKNSRGGPLRYQSVQYRWQKYCEEAGIDCTLHQLRHTHATEMVNEGVSLATIRKRLGHKNIQTTLRYAEKSDESA